MLSWNFAAVKREFATELSTTAKILRGSAINHACTNKSEHLGEHPPALLTINKAGRKPASKITDSFRKTVVVFHKENRHISLIRMSLYETVALH